MKNCLLDVCIVNFNSSDFIAVNLLALSKLTKNRFRVLVCDSGSSKKDIKKLKDICSQYDNVDLFFRRQERKGSLGHAQALNFLLDRTEAPYGCILDADCVFLRRNWDEILIKRITDKTKIIGTQAPPPKPQDFPLIFGVLFETETFRRLKINFLPAQDDSGSVTKDTGWEVREKFLKSGYQGEVLEMKNTRYFKNGPFAKISACAEYYLNGENRIFASHFGRGSNSFGKAYSNLKIPGLRQLSNYFGWIKDKKRWIRTALDIISRE
ncbi:hypothetical protein A2108_00660 [Candidatus Wolfebacteria bacterium GWA1_42_9]|uniref:Glycosyltransferase 2-like domain-containing protein n=3 Tax=Candidatus Wolfeibacteriota TaxID=1752735 RepID=A0A1F8DLK3_9BACT|nr:MAG: hypothetical protein UW08_C0017G0002 [Parcubacteria group bacterium GW2011_GWB1_43_8b]OGM89302.1 MAG: hypothetical protein A2108_00660 [Candidatus Wolfebacteria bacterium GWA1_42_9]